MKEGFSGTPFGDASVMCPALDTTSSNLQDGTEFSTKIPALSVSIRTLWRAIRQELRSRLREIAQVLCLRLYHLDRLGMNDVVLDRGCVPASALCLHQIDRGDHLLAEQLGGLLSRAGCAVMTSRYDATPPT